jgi:hypothetical protein
MTPNATSMTMIDQYSFAVDVKYNIDLEATNLTPKLLDSERPGVKFDESAEKKNKEPITDEELEAGKRRSSVAAKKRNKKAKPNRIMKTICKRSGLIGPAHLLHPNKSRRYFKFQKVNSSF